MGKNDVQNAYLLANIGRVYLDTRDMDKAAEYYKAAENWIWLPWVAIIQTQPAITTTWHHFREQGKYPESEQYFAKTLKVRLAKLGPNHRLTAKTLMVWQSLSDCKRPMRQHKN
jgi:hypothetical protein